MASRGFFSVSTVSVIFKIIKQDDIFDRMIPKSACLG